MADKNRKAAAWKARQVAMGRCPHCGKPCAPYRECERRRFTRRFYRSARILEKLGLIIVERINGRAAIYKSTGKVGKVREYNSGREGDRRLLPRIGKKPIDNIEEIILRIAEEHLEPFTTSQIVKEVGKVIVTARISGTTPM